MISAAFPYQKQRRRVLGREMAYVEVTVAGVHYLQEDSPHEIGRAITSWMGA
jgi:haloalkane dehalogenase